MQIISMVYTPENDSIGQALSQGWTVGDKVGFMFKPMIKSANTEERYVIGVITRIASDFQTCWVQEGKHEYIGIPLDRLTDFVDN